MTRLLSVALCLCAAGPLLSACAGVYVNDPQLAKSADAADASLQGADTIKPYDDQLANLNAFAGQEDLAMATLFAARRDKVIAGVLDKDDKDQGEALSKLNCDRLLLLLGNNAANCRDPARLRAVAGFASSYSDAIGFERQSLQLADSHRKAYEASVANAAPTQKPAADDCKTLVTAALPPDASVDLLNTQDSCLKAAQQDQTAKGLIQALVGKDTSGLLYQSNAAANAAANTAAPPALDDPALQALDGELKNTQAFAAAADPSSLQTFQDEVQRELTNATPAVKAAGWAKVETQLEAILEGVVCSQPPPAAGSTPPKTPDQIDCSKMQAGSEAGKVAATWRALRALEAVASANDPRVRSANWIAAAKAIAAAEKSDAQLLTTQTQMTATAALQQFQAQAQEASLLARSEQYLRGDVRCDVPPTKCALAGYVESWNSGRIPAEVLSMRGVQYLRVTSLQRWKSAAAEQRALMLAASGSLKGYADGGIQPATIAQTIFDLGLIGATAAK